MGKRRLGVGMTVLDSPKGEGEGCRVDFLYFTIKQLLGVVTTLFSFLSLLLSFVHFPKYLDMLLQKK